MQKYQRHFVKTMIARLQETSPLIQVIIGPRQVGKTTGIKQALAQLKKPAHYATADDLPLEHTSWLLEQWQRAKLLGPQSILVIDEVQKIENWSELIKKLWDAEQKPRPTLVLLGSSSLRIQKGLTESLTGRFELIPVHHWSFTETEKVFGVSLAEFIRYGGYPGAYGFIKDYARWRNYIKESILETVISKDILIFQRVNKPALFRQCFELAMAYPAQEMSYTKLLGQLQDKGNTDLVKYYLELFEGAFLLKRLEKFSVKSTLKKASTPKIIPLNTAFYTASNGLVKENSPEYGRLFEAAVGASLARLPGDLYYWREGSFEVDFVYRNEKTMYAVEVKSNLDSSVRGLEKFLEKNPKTKPVFINPQNFGQFDRDPERFLNSL